MKVNGKSQKQKIINSYVELRHEAFKEVSVDIMRQSVAIMLYALSRSEQGYSDEEILVMYEQFVSMMNFPEIDGKRLRSDDVTRYVVEKFGIDLNRINPTIGSMD